VQRALVRLAQASGRPVETSGLPHPFAGSHRAVPCELLRGRPIHDVTLARGGSQG
jgi:hypothetical protein